jgi:glycosyltransferase involved in cell wall biosynthesis
MKVLVANDLHGRSSAAGVAVAMAEGLAGRGHQVSFLATTQDPAGARHEPEGGVDVRVEPTPAYNLRFRAWRSLDNPAGVAAMRHAVEELRPDVVHVHNLHIHLSYAALAAAGSTGAKVVLHVHDVMPVCHQKMFCHLDERIVPGDVVRYRNGPLKCALCVRGRYNPLRNGRIRRVVGSDVTRLAAVSTEMARVLAENGFGEAAVIPNGLFPDRETATPEQVEALARRLGVAGRPVVFYGGRLDRLKGGLELVRALELVRRSVPRAVILTVGDALPGFAEEMADLAGRLGMADALVSAGWLGGSDLAAAYALADVVATPSLCFESFGLVNLEAMAAGRPVVASLWGGPSDVVADGETGFLVNPLQVGTLADRLIRLLADATLRERMGRAGRARVARLFSVDRQIDLTLELYRDMGLDTGTTAA